MMYKNTALKYVNAETYLRINAESNLIVQEGYYYPLPPLRIKLITEVESWPLRKWGVVGLSPHSDFFNYITNLYDEESVISIALKHSVRNVNKDTSQLCFDVYGFINPNESEHFEYSDTIGTFEIDTKNYNHWVLKGDLELEERGDIEKLNNQLICFDNSQNFMIGIEKSEEWCEEIRSIVCPDTIEGKCTHSNSLISEAPKLLMTIDNKVMELSEKEYIYFNKEGMQCHFGKTDESIMYKNCPNDTNIVVGKLFMSKFTPILIKEKITGKTELTLVKQFIIPPNYTLLFNIIGLFLFTLFLIGLTAFIYKKKKDSDEQFYVTV